MNGLEFLALPRSSASALTPFTEPLRSWFEQRFGLPTAAQRHAWPALFAGKNLLLSAPTGSGKSLAAFLPIVARVLERPFASSVQTVWRTVALKALAKLAQGGAADPPSAAGERGTFAIRSDRLGTRTLSPSPTAAARLSCVAAASRSTADE